MKYVVGLACRECGRGHALSAQAARDDCFGPLESCTTTTRSRLTYRPTSSREARGASGVTRRSCRRRPLRAGLSGGTSAFHSRSRARAARLNTVFYRPAGHISMMTVRRLPRTDAPRSESGPSSACA